MSMDLKKLTMELCRLPGPAGFETAVYKYIESRLQPFADEIRTDTMGNLLAWRRCGKPGAKILMLEAHMDEIGLIVTGAEEGFLRFTALGGVDPRVLPALEVRVLGERELYGVIDTMPPHVIPDSEMDKAVDMKKLCIDAGLTQEEAERLVPPGTPVVFGSGCEELGESLLCGKSLDDRACAAIMIKAFQELSGQDLEYDICLLLSTQEEVGTRGAVTGAWAAEPDLAVISDVTFAKAPDCPEITVVMGGGAAIGVGPNMNRALTEELFRIASERGIPCQTEVCPGGSCGTDAAVIQVSRMGVATALLSLPIRYMHTPTETALLTDMESVCRLVVEFALHGEV